MALPGIDTRGQFEMARVVSRSVAALRRNLGVFLALALLLSAIPSALAAAAQSMIAADAFVGASVLLVVVSSLVNLAGVYVLQCAIVHGTAMDLTNRRASFGDCLRTGLRLLLPAFGISLMVGILVGLASLLLVVPGIILAIMWCVAIPVKVIENKPMSRCTERSSDLTRGHRWALFGLFVAYFAIFWAIALIAGFASEALGTLPFPGGPLVGPMVVNVVSQVIISLFSGVIGSVGIAVIYFELRGAKEGIGANELASVFD